MKLIRSVRLRRKDSNSERLYEIDLVENDALGADRRYLINFRNGRPGSTLREGSRTATPLDRDAAEQLFDSMVVSRLNSGYRRDDDSAEASVPPAAVAAAPISPEEASGSEADAAADGRTAHLLARLETLARSPWITKDLDRLIWRIGQLRIGAAAPELLRLAQRQGPENISYSLVWALARTAGADAVSVLESVSRQAAMANVRDLARFALVSPLVGAAQQIDPGANLDAGVAHAAASRDASAIAGALTELAARDTTRPGPALITLACMAQSDPGLLTALAAALLLLPARPPFLIGLRRLFKYAEMADDAALFAATAHRFETATPMYSVRQTGRVRIWAPELGVAIRMDEDRGRPDARLGLSLATLLYLKRRSWRALRKRGETGDPAFADMAAACLLALRPQDLASPVTRTQWRRNEAGRWTRQQRVSGPLARNWTASQLLYRNDPAVRFGSARLTSDEAQDSRHAAARADVPGEAFPELWAARPDLALDLACDSPCPPVSALGVRVLKAAPDALRAAPAAVLARLLRAHDLAAQALGLAEARERLAAGDADPALLAALLEAEAPEARRLAARRIDAAPSLPWSDPDLALALLLTSHDDLTDDVLRWAQERRIDASDADALVSRLVAWLEACPIAPDEALDVRLRLLRQRLAALWADRPLPVSANPAARLLGHGAPGVVAVGVDMLALADVDAGVISSDMWQMLLGSSSADVQTAALRLFNRLDDDALAGHAPLVIAFATAPVTELRQAARPLVARLAARDPVLSEKLGRELVDSLFRTAPDDAWPQDMVDLFYAAMPQQAAALDAGMLWRLLQARAKGAQLLGAAELPNRAFGTFSVRQIARLGAHAHLAVRQWVMAAFADDPARFQREAADAVLLIESDWEDIRAFARATFDQWPQEAWDLPTLAVVTDSVKPDVLAFARHLLRSRLSPEDAPEQLTRLLEHPAQSMHLLATELLTEDAVASEAAFERLLPLARIIMLQVHKGRIAKDRISAFLRAEAMRDASRAAQIAPLFSDLSLAGVARDRAFAILALRDITQAYPDIATPLVRRAAPQRAA